jgi:cell wall assembly regulator SMI1
MSGDHLQALLAQLEQAWDDAGDQATVARLAPGLDRVQILDAVFGLPLTLHPDAITWFTWHNGPRPGERRAPIGASWMQFISLKDAVALYYHRADAAAGIAMDEGITKAYAGWDPQWFPVAQAIDGTTLAIDCSTPANTPAPIRSIYGLADEDPEPIDFTSLADLVQAWLDLYMSGAYTYVDGAWHKDRDRIPLAMRREAVA